MNDFWDDFTAGLLTLLVWLGAMFLTVGAWITSIMRSADTESFVMLAVACILPPIGVVHGWLIWLGFF